MRMLCDSQPDQVREADDPAELAGAPRHEQHCHVGEHNRQQRLQHAAAKRVVHQQEAGDERVDVAYYLPEQQ